MRRTKRLTKVAATLAAKPLDSLGQACETFSDIKGAYRLIANKHVTSEMLITPSTEHAVKACQNHPVILAVSDTTSLNFTNHRATSGLGPIGGKIQYQGINFHSTLALRPDGLPLGLVRQKAWVRDGLKFGKRHQRKQKPIQDKESFNWIEDITHIDHALDRLEENERPYVIHIFDREGDIYEAFQTIQQAGAGCVIRSAWNRRITGEQKYLHDQVLNTKILHRQFQDVKRQHGKPKRQALLEYRAATVTLEPSFRKFRPREPLQINIVAVHEINPPQNVEPIQWFLNTTEPIDSVKDVLEIARLYTMRWRIEEYHLILKSGCRIEKVQFESADNIKKILSLMAAAALRLLQITYQARLDPDLACTVVLGDSEWRALQARIQHKRVPKKARPPTLRQAILWIGRLGGHMGRKSDGMPGVRTLWRGWRDLQILVVMFEIYQEPSQTPVHS